MIPLNLNEATSYFKVRKPTQEEYEDQNNLKIELPISPEYSHQKQSMSNYRGWFVSPTLL